MVIGRKLYSVIESYWIFHHGIRTMKYMYRSKRKNELSPKFIERIMLEVTMVNECSYVPMPTPKGHLNME